jgi:2-dehydropantoate 2-reductase
MRIAIFGVGGVGGYFGGRLSQAGEDVVFVARGEHLRAIRERGLLVESVLGDFVIHPAQAVEDPAQAGRVDLVIVGVKAWQVPEAAEALRPMVGPETFALTLQNGVEAPDQVAAVLGPSAVLGGLANIISFVDGPGRIRHIGGPASIRFGEFDSRTSDRSLKLREAFSRAGIAAEIAPDTRIALWEKFLFIVPVGGVGAVTRAPIGLLRTTPEAKRMLEQGMREILALARARGVALDDTVIERTFRFLDTLPPEGTTSMQRDIMGGRPSELEAWNGAVVRLGREADVPTPLHDFLYGSLVLMERKARGELSFPG